MFVKRFISILKIAYFKILHRSDAWPRYNTLHSFCKIILIWNAHEFLGNIWKAIQSKGQLHEGGLERVGMAMLERWGNGVLRLPRGWVILSISQIVSYCPVCVPALWTIPVLGVDWQEQGRAAHQPEDCVYGWVKQPERTNHVGMTWCYQWVSLQTVTWRPTASLALEHEWKRAEKHKLQFVLPVCILLHF